MSINTDYRPVPTDLEQPQPVTTSYWRTFKITMKVTLPHVPGMLLLGTSALMYYLSGNNPDCDTLKCHRERDKELGVGVGIASGGIVLELVASYISVALIKNHLWNNSISTPEGIESLRDGLKQSDNARAFIRSYEFAKGALIELKIFTEEEMDQIEREATRYDNLVTKRNDLNKILDPEFRAQRQNELDAEALVILNSWACFKEKYLGKHCASSSSSREQV